MPIANENHVREKPYNHKNCASLFGYAAAVHQRSGGKCALCDCGGSTLQFDMWRQMTVEHLIGKSQKGYLKEIRVLVKQRFPNLSEADQENFSRQIDALNTVTCCSFCNSTTSRDSNPISMEGLLQTTGNPEDVLASVSREVARVLERKRGDVAWKLRSVRKAFDREFLE